MTELGLGREDATYMEVCDDGGGVQQRVGAQLGPEIWSRVLYFLRRDTPAALSRPARRYVRQGDLVKAMQMFYELALPYLYTTIIVDDLPALLYAHPRMSCSGRLQGKASHLRRIKHLYLEQMDKSALDPTDMPSMTTAYQAELHTFHRGITSPVFSIRDGPFPNLETLALGAIYGPNDPTSWTSFCRTKLDPIRGRMIREVSDAMHRLMASPRLKHICQRGGGGMMNFPALIEEPPPVLSTAILTTHIQAGWEHWTLPCGKATRWVLDPPLPPAATGVSATTPIGPTWSTVLQNVKSALNLVSSMRPWTPVPAEQQFILDIYASGSYSADTFDRRKDDSLPPGWRWEGMTAAFWDCVEGKDLEKVVKVIKAGMTGFGAGKDEVRWLPRRKAPRCEACGLH